MASTNFVTYGPTASSRDRRTAPRPEAGRWNLRQTATLGNAAATFNVTASDTIENEAAAAGGLGANIFTNTGTLTVGGTDVGGTTTASAGTLTLSNDWVDNFVTTTYGITR